LIASTNIPTINRRGGGAAGEAGAAGAAAAGGGRGRGGEERRSQDEKMERKGRKGNNPKYSIYIHIYIQYCIVSFYINEKRNGRKEGRRDRRVSTADGDVANEIGGGDGELSIVGINPFEEVLLQPI